MVHNRRLAPSFVHPPVAIPEQVADLGALNPLDKDLLYQVQGLRRRFLALEKEEPDKIVEETSRLLVSQRWLRPLTGFSGLLVVSRLVSGDVHDSVVFSSRY